jgi:polysaccharide biosynthesis transport protein
MRLQEQLLRYQAGRDSLTSGLWRSNPNSPDVQRLDQLIQSTERQLAEAAYAARQAELRDLIRSSEARMSSIAEVRERAAQELQALPPTEAEEVRLLTQAQQIGEAALRLREEFQRARIAEAVEGGQVEVIDEALPGVPVHGGKIRTIVFGLLLGLLVGGASAIVRERANTSIRRKDEIEEALRIPELAVIPRIGEAVAARNRIWLPLGPREGNGTNGNGKGRGVHLAPQKSQELVAAFEPHTPAAEAYRTLRTNLVFSQSNHALKRLVITSSAPAEGKSTTAANLAACFAQQGMRVLLVDCDLRKARLHRMFGVPREPGFTQVLLGLETLDSVVHATPVDNLHFLASGTLPPNPAELIGGSQMKRVLQELDDAFDMVLLDTPPLLAASDAAILGTQCDGVVLVVRAGQTERDAAQQSVRKLVTLGARILGAVLNDPDSKVGQYGGYYAYEYYGAEK